MFSLQWLLVSLLVEVVTELGRIRETDSSDVDKDGYWNAAQEGKNHGHMPQLGHGNDTESQESPVQKYHDKAVWVPEKTAA